MREYSRLFDWYDIEKSKFKTENEILDESDKIENILLTKYNIDLNSKNWSLIIKSVILDDLLGRIKKVDSV
jgi:hypothetical protein